MLTDVIIIGGSVAGSAVAAALKNSSFSITILESKPMAVDTNRGDLLYPSSLHILEEWGVLDDLLKEEHIKIDAVHLAIEEKFNLSISMSNAYFPFAVSMEHANIEKIILKHALSEKTTLLSGAYVKEIVCGRDGIEGVIAISKGKEILIRAKLIIGADGRNSLLRHAFNEVMHCKEYHLDAVVFTLFLEKAVEPYLAIRGNGETALLVQTIPGNGHMRVGLHLPLNKGKEWILKTQAEKLIYLASFDPLFHTGIKPIEREHIYQFHLAYVENMTTESAVLIGDAAHEIHPISTKGMEMALADAALLAKYIGVTLENISDKLKAFNDERKLAVQTTLMQTDAFASYFTPSSQIMMNYQPSDKSRLLEIIQNEYQGVLQKNCLV